MHKVFMKILELLFRLRGWKLSYSVPKEIRKCVMVGAPHTSNWDFVACMGAFSLMKLPLRFTIKSELFFFPLNLILRSMGALEIKRDKSMGLTKSLIQLFQNWDDSIEPLVVMVTPEGTRSFRDKWKSGFYYIALEAKVPIVLGYADYAKKEAGVGKVIIPTGDIKKDFAEIMAFYRTVTPKFPEKFNVNAGI
jgi:1-acyl-sn-glycerol-3-phosphate acyltransferase